MLDEEFEAGAPVEEILGLVEHSLCVDADQPVEVVYQSFQKEHEREFVAVVTEGRMIGLVGRGQLGFLLGARYGFGLYARHPISEHLIESHTSFRQGTPLLEILNTTLHRSESTFYDDIAVVDSNDKYLGLISVQKLVRLQSRMISEQATLAETQRKSLEVKNSQLFRSLHELKQSQGKLGILFQNSALGVALLNPKGQIESCNSYTQSLLGIAMEDDITRTFNLADFVLANMRQDFLHQLKHLEAGRLDPSNHRSEFTLELPDHGPRLFRMFSSWIIETGQICVLLDDITEQRMLERRMAQEERAVLLESLAGGIAHEINNKLSPILGYTELMMTMLNGKGERDLLSYCSIIQDCAVESSKIIGQLLQLSRPPNAEKTLCDLHEISEQAVSIVRFQLRKVEAEIVFDFASEKLSLIADAAQLKQVMMNLLINSAHAVEGLPKRTITIGASVKNDNLFWTISDTGHGIKAEHLKRIFDPFFTTKDPNRGTGLGLGVCFSIIEQHNGQIDIKSEVNQGTQISITLPRVTNGFTGSSQTTETQGEAFIMAGRSRVLVVDDEDFVTSLIQETLRSRLNCHVDRASNGLKAIETLENDSFDLIISDVRMGGLDGFGLLEWIRHNRPELVPHFFLITGDAGSADLNHKLETLGVPVLHKPFKIAQLLAKCSELVRPPTTTQDSRPYFELTDRR